MLFALLHKPVAMFSKVYFNGKIERKITKPFNILIGKQDDLKVQSVVVVGIEVGKVLKEVQ